MTGDNRDKRFAPLRTQQEVAAIIGTGQRNVSQGEQRALRKMRQAAEQEAASQGLTLRQWLFGE